MISVLGQGSIWRMRFAHQTEPEQSGVAKFHSSLHKLFFVQSKSSKSVMTAVNEVHSEKSIVSHSIEGVAGHIPVYIEQGDPLLLQLPVDTGQLVRVLAVDIKLVQVPGQSLDHVQLIMGGWSTNYLGLWILFEDSREIICMET